MAAIDVETSKYYEADDMKKQKLDSMYCNDQLGDIISLAIVSIDEDLIIKKKKYTFKPCKPIDARASRIHGFDDKFFNDNADLYDHFTMQDAKEINQILMSMKHVYAHN